MLATERDRELPIDDLHDLLPGREALHDLLRQGAAADTHQKVVGDLHRDVGFEQRGTDVAEGGVHLPGVELASRPELLEDAVQAVGERVEHVSRVPEAARSRLPATGPYPTRGSRRPAHEA